MTMLSRSDIRACRTLLRGGSLTFHRASYFLPPDVRDAATALYAFCRVADDEVDNGGGLVAIANLRRRLDRIYGGGTLDNPIDRSFAAVARYYAIPRVVPEALFEGFEWDVEGRRYDSINDVYAYGARVAGSVGIMMSLVMGANSARLLDYAAKLGVAMQLSNIARDVGEDSALGRLYLPRAWLSEAGIDADAWLARPAHSEALAGVVRRLLAAAETLYDHAAQGVEGLPRSCRFGIRAARALYREIGCEVLRNNADSVTQRAVVPAKEKLRLLGLSAFPAQRCLTGPVPILAETQYLVAAASHAHRSRQRDAAMVETKLVTTLTLFEKLERRERAARLLRIPQSG